MRKLFSLVLCVFMLLSFCSCFNMNPVDSTPVPIQVTYNPNTDDPGTEFPTSGLVSVDPAESVTPAISPRPDFTPAEPTPTAEDITPEPTATPTPTPSAAPTAAPTPKPTVSCNPFPTSEEEIKLANKGKRFMEKLRSLEGYEKLDIKAKPGFPYLICVNIIQSCVTVFCVDENGNYTRPYQSMICTGGVDSPEGIFRTINNYGWQTLMGPCYGQYCTRIYKGILFHSVPYKTPHKYDLDFRAYNRLGWIISHGCIRLAVNDAKWIFDNCPLGTTVVIYNDSSSSGPMGRPVPIRVDKSNIYTRGWDPTDPDPANPHGTTYMVGSTKRSELAWAD